MRALDVKLTTLATAAFAVVTYVLCIAYGLLVPARLHGSPLLEVILPGFRWLDAGSFVLGLVESAIYGAYAGAMFSALYNWLGRRFQLAEPRGVPR